MDLVKIKYIFENEKAFCGINMRHCWQYCHLSHSGSGPASKCFYSNKGSSTFCSLHSLLLQGQYTKITFRSPLYVGGSPNAYWLVKATGTNRGFLGCIQSLTINNKATDIRPWPLGRALSGADIGEEAYSMCGSLYRYYLSLAAATNK